MAKVYVQAWAGPWGWRQAFYDWFDSDKHGFELTESIADADLVFQADTTDWRNVIDASKGKKLLCNVLDFAEWKEPDGAPSVDTIAQAKIFKAAGANFTAISNKVIEQLDDFIGVEADLFYYPSQVTEQRMKETGLIGGKKMFITFSRLGDPGKAIPQAIEAFEQSKLAEAGWRYMLVGPERPPVATLPNRVMYAGYVNADQLAMMIRQAGYVFMPSYGEGLGLPIIEGSLLGTPYVTRAIEPMRTLLDETWDTTCAFKDDDAMSAALVSAARDFKSDNYEWRVKWGFVSAKPWIRENAFDALANRLKLEVSDVQH